MASWHAGFRGWPLFLAFVALGVFLILVLGNIEMDEHFIRHIAPLTGRCEMKWGEVEKIEMAQNGDMVLHGNNKRLAVPSMSLWSGNDKRAMMALFNTQINRRGIRTERTARAGFQMSKNTRLKD